LRVLVGITVAVVIEDVKDADDEPSQTDESSGHSRWPFGIFFIFATIVIIQMCRWDNDLIPSVFVVMGISLLIIFSSIKGESWLSDLLGILANIIAVFLDDNLVRFFLSPVAFLVEVFTSRPRARSRTILVLCEGITVVVFAASFFFPIHEDPVARLAFSILLGTPITCALIITLGVTLLIMIQIVKVFSYVLRIFVNASSPSTDANTPLDSSADKLTGRHSPDSIENQVPTAAGSNNWWKPPLSAQSTPPPETSPSKAKKMPVRQQILQHDPIGEMKIEEKATRCIFSGDIDMEISCITQSGISKVQCPKCGAIRTIRIQGNVVMFPSHPPRVTSTSRNGERWIRRRNVWELSEKGEHYVTC